VIWLKKILKGFYQEGKLEIEAAIIHEAFFMNNSGELGLFTSRDYRRCKASAHEAVVFHREWAATKQMR